MKASEREKAVLFALAAGQLEGWKQAFILSSQKSEADVSNQKNITTSAERWRRRPDIIQAFERAQKYVRELIQEGRTERETETATDNVSTKTRQASRLDYYDPANQRKTINAIIEAAKDDPKTQLDAIKAIQQTQRDDRQAAKDQQTQRIYSPLRCYECPLHDKALKDSEKRTK